MCVRRRERESTHKNLPVARPCKSLRSFSTKNLIASVGHNDWRSSESIDPEREKERESDRHEQDRKNG